MYARLINLTFGEDVTHDRADELCREIIHECRKIEGFRGYAFMLMSNARRGITLTYWNDADCASRAGEQILPTMIARMRGLLREPPEIIGYEVVEHEMIDSEVR